mmetsp:Transcript_46484/g.113186  ORF Transcript_46484/g.113186 Transcript_46484/m.113186 type:complete len:355 (-) Transcript_46484:584-1648(-)
MSEGGPIVVAELVEHLGDAAAQLGEVLDGHSDVLEQHRRAGLAHGAHHGDESLARVPEGGALGGVVGELDGGEGGDAGLLDYLGDLVDARLHRLLGVAAALDEEGRRLVGLPAQEVHVLHILARGHRGAIEELNGVGALGLTEVVRGRGRILHAREDEEGRRLVLVVGHRVVRHARHEPEGALGAHHEVLDHLDRRVEVDERVDAVPSRALDAELLVDERHELGVVLAALRERHHAVDQRLVRLLERRPRRRVMRVEDGAVVQHHADVLHSVVRVLRHAAAHARAIVGHNAPDPARLDARRVGAELAAVGREHAVYLPKDPAGLDSDLGPVLRDLAVAPRVAQLEQDRVRDGLA